MMSFFCKRKYYDTGTTDHTFSDGKQHCNSWILSQFNLGFWQYLTPFLISILNQITVWLLQNIIAKKKYKSKYDERINVSISVTTTLVLNTGLATLLTTLGGLGNVDWYKNVGACIVMNMVYDILIPNFMKLLYGHSQKTRRCFDRCFSCGKQK